MMMRPFPVLSQPILSHRLLSPPPRILSYPLLSSPLDIWRNIYINLHHEPYEYQDDVNHHHHHHEAPQESHRRLQEFIERQGPDNNDNAGQDRPTTKDTSFVVGVKESHRKARGIPIERKKDWTTMTTHGRTDQQRRTISRKPIGAPQGAHRSP